MPDNRLFAGIDSGSTTTKVLLLNNDKEILGSRTVPTGVDVKKTAFDNLKELLTALGRYEEDIKAVVSTGYGRDLIDISSKVVTEITCHARGVHYFFPEAVLVIDIGGQDSKVIKMDKNGQAVDFRMNDKCAAGTGRFLEVMARRLDLDIEELGSLDVDLADKVTISSTCTVFAESEVVSHLARGASKNAILAGVLDAIVSRVVSMAKAWAKSGGEIVFTGGVARNDNVWKLLSIKLEQPVKRPSEPQIIGALGAALLASQIN